MTIRGEKKSIVLAIALLLGACGFGIYWLIEQFHWETETARKTREAVAHCAAIRGEVKMINRYTSYCISETETFEIGPSRY